MRAARAIVVLMLCATAFAQEHKVGVMKYALPHYPPIARQARVSGEVKVVFLINYAGETSVRSVEGHPILKAQFAELLKKWQLICTSCKFGESFDYIVRFKFVLSDTGTWPQRYELRFPEEILIITEPPPCIAYDTQVVVTKPWYLRWIGRQRVRFRDVDRPCNPKPTA